MNDLEFFNSFNFKEYTLKVPAHTNNSGGVACHFVGYIKSGRGVFECDGERIEVFEGDLFYIPKGCRYHSYWSGEGTVCFDSYGFDYLPNPQKTIYKLQKIELSESGRKLLDSLSADKSVNLSSVGKLYSLLGEAVENMSAYPSDLGLQTVQRAIEYMRANPSCRMGEVARACAVSESTLYLEFKKIVGRTPNMVCRQIRCEIAEQLLTTTNLSVEEISTRLEFSSSSYFRKIFFSVTGKTPRQIRKEASFI